MKYSKSQINRMEEMLDAKEKRAYIQKKIIEKYKMPLISFMLNIPGEDKNSQEAVEFHKKYIEVIKNTLYENNIQIIFEEYFNKKTGMEFYAVVKTDATELKKLMVKIEENTKAGRLLDIDIFNESGIQISRSDLNLPERKCIICDKDAKICMRESNHNLIELKNRVIYLMRC